MKWDVARQSGVDALMAQFAADGLVFKPVGTALIVELPGDDATVIMNIEQYARTNDVIVLQIPDFWQQP